jgi:hypothetical protein
LWCIDYLKGGNAEKWGERLRLRLRVRLRLRMRIDILIFCMGSKPFYKVN